MRARPMTPADVDRVAAMRAKLFPDEGTAADHRAELIAELDAEGEPGRVGNQACFVAEDGERLVGFAEVMLRSHAEGCWDVTADGRLGVACLEAWWVEESARGSGVGRVLVKACEEWALAQGSPVLASDALLDNRASHVAHEALGFEEVERVVHYRKDL
jgi:aminoglycoside 6'-N-acetyltransferase I